MSSTDDTSDHDSVDETQGDDLQHYLQNPLSDADRYRYVPTNAHPLNRPQYDILGIEASDESSDGDDEDGDQIHMASNGSAYQNPHPPRDSCSTPNAVLQQTSQAYSIARTKLRIFHARAKLQTAITHRTAALQANQPHMKAFGTRPSSTVPASRSLDYLEAHNVVRRARNVVKKLEKCLMDLSANVNGSVHSATISTAPSGTREETDEVEVLPPTLSSPTVSNTVDTGKVSSDNGVKTPLTHGPSIR